MIFLDMCRPIVVNAGFKPRPDVIYHSFLWSLFLVSLVQLYKELKHLFFHIKVLVACAEHPVVELRSMSHFLVILII